MIRDQERVGGKTILTQYRLKWSIIMMAKRKAWLGLICSLTTPPHCTPQIYMRPIHSSSNQRNGLTLCRYFMLVSFPRTAHVCRSLEVVLSTSNYNIHCPAPNTSERTLSEWTSDKKPERTKISHLE